MRKPVTRSIFNLFGFALISTTFALAQATTSFTAPVSNDNQSWESAQSLGSAKHKLIVITLDQPDRRQTCHVRSFTKEKLVCARGLGSSRAYLPQQIAAIILPGDEKSRLPLFLAFNGGLGAAIWGTVALAAACPVCAAATGVAALLFFATAGAVAYADDQPDRTIYLSPDRHLTSKLGSIQLWTPAGVD
jgi:hypothetical protein